MAGVPLKKHLTLSNIAGTLLLVLYTLSFWRYISPYWFNPDWITDDALQQVYPFYEVFYPDLFKGDPVTDSMKGYFAPLHYWLCYLLTWLTGDPIMMSHWMMFVQIALTVIFIFLSIRALSAWLPACLGFIWFLHSPLLIQRLNGGLARGWMAPLSAIYLYLAIKEKHSLIIAVIIVACLLNPLSALVIITAHGMYLLFKAFSARSSAYRKHFLYFILFCPVFLLVTWLSVRRPEAIGKMVTYEEALKMPELSLNRGRFKIAPLPPPRNDFRFSGFQVFVADFYKGKSEIGGYLGLPAFTVNTPKATRFVRRNIEWIATALIILLVTAGIIRRRKSIPSQAVFLLAASIVCYIAARMTAFNLYIPGRYIRFPWAIFFIVGVCVAAWRVFHRSRDERDQESALKSSWGSHLALGLIATLVFFGSGTGFLKQANFNYRKGQDGNVFDWLKKNTEMTAVIAGHPAYMDPTSLFAVRKTYISNETAHPFYDRYYELVKHRMEISLRAHYAKSFKELYDLLKDENIDYFVFERKRFYPDELADATYFAPFDTLVKEITSGDPEKFAYRLLPENVDEKNFPFMPFKDYRAAVIDVKKLGESLSPDENNRFKRGPRAARP